MMLAKPLTVNHLYPSVVHYLPVTSSATRVQISLSIFKSILKLCKHTNITNIYIQLLLLDFIVCGKKDIL